jgi:acyl-coenzyme A thioesterase PaaI-like protein
VSDEASTPSPLEPGGEAGGLAAAALRAVLELAGSDPTDERQATSRRVGTAARLAIDRLTATAAPVEVLAEVEARMQDAAQLLEGHGTARAYEGTAEASGLGRDRGFFDWSPQLGLSNPLAPPLHAAIEGDKVVALVRYGSAYEGPPGCVHGGFVAAAFDEVLGLAQSLAGQAGMTANLTVRYRRPTPLYKELRFEARLDSVNGRKVTTSAVLKAGDEVTAEATGLFITVSAQRFESLVRNRRR